MLKRGKLKKINYKLGIISFLGLFLALTSPSLAATLQLINVERVNRERLGKLDFEIDYTIQSNSVDRASLDKISPNPTQSFFNNDLSSNQEWSLSLLDPFNELRLNGSGNGWDNDNYQVSVLPRVDAPNTLKGVYDFALNPEETITGDFFTFSADNQILQPSTGSLPSFSWLEAFSANGVASESIAIIGLSVNRINSPTTNSIASLSLLPKAFGELSGNDEEGGLNAMLNALTRLGSLTTIKDNVALLSEENYLATVPQYRFTSPVLKSDQSIFETSNQMLAQRLENQKEYMDEYWDKQRDMQQEIVERFEEQKERQREMRREQLEKRREQEQDRLEKAREKQQKLAEKAMQQQQKRLQKIQQQQLKFARQL